MKFSENEVAVLDFWELYQLEKASNEKTKLELEWVVGELRSLQSILIDLNTRYHESCEKVALQSEILDQIAS